MRTLRKSVENGVISSLHVERCAPVLGICYESLPFIVLHNAVPGIWCDSGNERPQCWLWRGCLWRLVSGGSDMWLTLRTTHLPSWWVWAQIVFEAAVFALCAWPNSSPKHGDSSMVTSSAVTAGHTCKCLTWKIKSTRKTTVRGVALSRLQCVSSISYFYFNFQYFILYLI